MNINDFIYIYYCGENNPSNVSLEKYTKYLKNPYEKKQEIIKIFENKFYKDFIESSSHLLKNQNLYAMGIILVSGIDVLSKHYSGNTTVSNIGYFYKEFMRNYFPEINSLNLNDEFYYNFRCSLVHSGSTGIEFTLEDNISKTIKEIDERIIINLKWILSKLKNCLSHYLYSLGNINNYNKFIAVQNTLYPV